jgi:hypothetical protein
MSLVPLDPVARKAELAETKRQIRTDVPLLDANNWTEFAGVGESVPGATRMSLDDGC